jgi:predicted transcriptional regulator
MSMPQKEWMIAGKGDAARLANLAASCHFGRAAVGIAKEEALELIRKMPDDVSTGQILDELYFKEQVERGLKDIAEGRTITHNELKERIAQWRKSAGR